MSQTEPKRSDAIRPLIVGNWKMNGIKTALAEAIKVKDALSFTEGHQQGGSRALGGVDVMICPPATLIMVLSEVLRGSSVHVGGQDCHAALSGAFTGDIAAPMLRDGGATAVILGHSERRSFHGERDCDVRVKVSAAHRAGLTAIVCVGETAGERAAGLTEMVVHRQLAGSLPDECSDANTVIAYEPIWAIGTGLMATPADIATVHAAIVASLTARFGEQAAALRVLYGGSVKPGNAADLMQISNVHGALVGGASLVAADFLAIIRATAAAT